MRHPIEREPCPDRIIDDVGAGFGFGAIGGSAVYFLKGIYQSPRGERFVGGAQAMRMNAPRIGGTFAVWNGLFSVADCSFVYLRQKEDPWNSILAGAAASGVTHMRQGLGAASRSAMVGGVLVALIEGISLTLARMAADLPPPVPLESPPPAKKKSSWFGDLFGGGGEKKEK